MSDLIAHRSQVEGQMAELEQRITDLILETSSIVTTSKILDSGIAVPHAHLRRALLNVISGVVAALALTGGVILLLAVTTRKVRLRADVAAALGAPVRLSVRRLRGGFLAALPGQRSSGAAQDMLVTEHLLAQTIAKTGPHAALAIVAVGCEVEAAEVLLRLASRLSYDRAVVLVDLSEHGSLSRRRSRGGLRVAAPASPGGHEEFSGASPRHGSADLVRPVGVPSLAVGPLAEGTGSREGNDHARDRANFDVMLSLVTIDPALGADNLPSWSTDAVAMVRGGRCTPERIQATAHLVRSSGVALRYGILVGSAANDDTLGLLPDEYSKPGGIVGP